MVMRIVLLLFVLCGPAAAAPAVINSTGGTNATDGLRIRVGGSGQIQVRKNGQNQFFTFGAEPDQTTTTQIDNGIYLGIGALNQAGGPTGVLVGPQHDNFTGNTPPASMQYVEWNQVPGGGPTGSTGNFTGSGTATFYGRYDAGGGRLYTLTVVYSYVRPDDHVTVTWTLSAPAGNTQPLTIYHAFDSTLGGTDTGPSFHSTVFGNTAGVYNTATSRMEAFRYLSGQTWSHHFAGLNNCMFSPWTGVPSGAPNCGPSLLNMSMQLLDNFPDLPLSSTSPTTDNGFGVQWSLGVIAGTTRSSTNELFFRPFSPALTTQIAPASIASGGASTLIFTIENEPSLGAHASLSFTDVFRASPLQMRIASPMNLTNTCGGSVVDGGGGALAPGDTGIQLSNGALATNVASCTLSIDVTAVNVSGSSQSIVNDSTDVSVTNMTNSVSAQTLQVATRPPPTITSVTSTTANGTYGIGDTVVLDVNVSAPVPSGQSLTLTLSSGAMVPALCGAPGPCTALRASYVVANGNNTALLTVSAVSGTLTDTVGATNASPSVPGGSNLNATRSIAIDGTPPAVPSVTAPLAGAVLTNAMQTVSGTTSPGAVVEVRENAAVLCTTTASGSGNFTCALVFAQGAHSIFATATDAVGNTSANSPVVNFTVDVPSVPTIAGITSNNASGIYGIGAAVGLAVELSLAAPSGQTLTLTLSSGVMVNATCDAPGPCTTLHANYVVAEGETAAVLLVSAVSGTLVSTLGGSNAAPSVPGGANLDASKTIVIDGVAPVFPTLTAPSDGATLAVAMQAVSGTTAPQATVVVYEGAAPLCTTTADALGAFTCPVVFADGEHTIFATATDAAGNTSSASVTVTVVVAVPPPAAPVVLVPSDGAALPEDPLVISGTSTPFTLVTVRVDGTQVCETLTLADGTFSCPPVMLTLGAHTIDAAAYDQGKTSAPSAVVSVRVSASAGGDANASGSGDSAGADTNDAGDLTLRSNKSGCACRAQADTQGVEASWLFAAAWFSLVWLRRRQARHPQ